VKHWRKGRRRIGSLRFGTKLERAERWLTGGLMLPMLWGLFPVKPPLWLAVILLIIWVILFVAWIVVAIKSHYEVPKGWS